MEILSWSGISEERLSPSIIRRMFWGENIMVTKWDLAPDTTFPVHDHVSEQITMVERGDVTILFPEGQDVTLNEGDMLVIPSSVPHGVRTGPRGCTVMDLFSPIRRDFIQGTASYLPQAAEPGGQEPSPTDGPKKDPYEQLGGFLSSAGKKVPMEQLREIPLDLLARYVYERACITMGQLRQVLGIDKKQAKELLRQWKHGDDHSESSLQRKLERMIMLPWEMPKSGRKDPDA